jgi:large subunit ribosomal protein L22
VLLLNIKGYIEMEAKATAKFVRYTPRKVNQVLALIRNKKVEKAFEILSFLPKLAAKLVKEVLKSAIANAGKFEDYSNLKVKEAWIGSGSILKRIRAGSKGKSLPIKKRMVHLTIVVTDVGVSVEKTKRRTAKKEIESKKVERDKKFLGKVRQNGS